MKRVGLLVGSERTFPDALIAAINGRAPDVVADLVRIGGTPMDAPCPYAVLIDRISHEVPFYQSYLKNALLQGVYIVNNPLWRIADDKFFGTSVARALGVAVPRTIVLPNKSYLADVVPGTLRNLTYPLDWNGIVAYTGLPAVLKQHWGGGWANVYVVHTLPELIARYDESGSVTMILQEYIAWEQYVRAIVIGRDQVLPVLWDPRVPHHERYQAPQPALDHALKSQVIHESLLLCRALGYDMNTVEFGIRDGVPYAIDFMNSAPDFDLSSLGEEIFRWVVDAMADLAIRAAREGPRPPTAWPELFAAPAPLGSPDAPG